MSCGEREPQWSDAGVAGSASQRQRLKTLDDSTRTSFTEYWAMYSTVTERHHKAALESSAGWFVHVAAATITCLLLPAYICHGC